MYGALGDPFAHAVTCALLHAGDQGRVVDDAVEYLALRRLGCARGGCGLGRSRREGAATHFGSAPCGDGLLYCGVVNAQSGAVGA